MLSNNLQDRIYFLRIQTTQPVLNLVISHHAESIEIVGVMRIQRTLDAYCLHIVCM